MKDEIPVTEADLHAYLDNQLSPERRKLVEDWLQHNPDEAKRIADYQLLSDKLHGTFDHITNEKIPTDLRQLAVGARSRFKRTSVFHFPFAASLLIVGGLIGWFSNAFLGQQDNHFYLTNLIKPAAFAHTVYASDRQRPVEIKSNTQEQLIQWLSKRLKTRIKAPNLAAQGYRLIGGRLIPSTNRMAAQFMYESNKGQRITLYVRRVSSYRGTVSLKQFNTSENLGLHIIYWRQGEMGYAISGSEDRDTLTNLAKESRGQISI